MIQLKVYDNPDKVNQYWIDLYDTEPIKLTLSIEDITQTDATSTYSKTFKVPGTRKNNQFFKNAFDIDGVLYDVTIKKPAEILVDGSEFKQGHIRLQKIFTNKDRDTVEYELLFLGETRDFSSLIGDKGLCELVMPDLVGNGAGGVLTPANVETSWTAYPQSPSITAGLANGNIIYPLIDHGNTYDDQGNVEQTEVRTGSVAGGEPFTNPNHPLTLPQLKPMIRAKRIWDQIFQDAGYTYTSDFLTSTLFHQIYISAFGNEATIGYQNDDSSSANALFAHEPPPQSNQGLMLVNDIVNDPGNNYYTVSGHSQYWAPATGTYEIRMSAFYTVYVENSDYTQTVNPGRVRIMKNGVELDFSSPGNNVQLTVTWTGTLQPGDVITMDIDPQFGRNDGGSVTNARFEVLRAPGALNPARLLDCSYKQIDFIKDILTSFRLVLSPDPYKPNNFIVEPWQTYINSGELHDWSHKLVEDKDVQIEPVFFSQSDQINFHFQKGGDWINVYHQAAYNGNEYGYLQFDSGNDLLKGKRDITLLGVAPTEIIQVEGSSDGFVVPQMHVHESEDGQTRHLPIKPKTRMLFYNGLIDITNSQNYWYLQGAGTNPKTTWPLVSPYQHWPIQTDSLTLNWANDVQYWGTIPGYNNKGVTLYQNYWSRYIESLYNKFSRRVTAYFVLNNVDLNYFSFDDTIFVNGVYYIPEKIIDLQVGDYTEVQVQLLTANDYQPTFIQNETLTGVVMEPFNDTCGEGLGYINVTTNGTPEFTWALNNGMTGTVLTGAAPGNAPYLFTINNVPPGVWTVTLTDSLGRDYAEDVTVPLSSATPITAGVVVTPASDCFSCDGNIEITPTGGTAPYTINWITGGPTPGGIAAYSYTNNPAIDNTMYSALAKYTDYVNYPQYTIQGLELRMHFVNTGPYNFNTYTDTLVVNDTQGVEITNGGQTNFEAPASGTYPMNIEIELYKIQNVDTSTDSMRLRFFDSSGEFYFEDYAYPTLAVGETGYISINTSVTVPNTGPVTVLLTQAKDIPPFWPVGPVFGYRSSITIEGEGFCPNQTHSFVVVDSEGCYSPQYDIEVPCESTGFVYIARKHSSLCDQLGLVDYIVQSPGVITPTDVFTIQGLDGCYSIFSETEQTPQYVVDSFFIDCPTCQGLPENNNWEVTNCDSIETLVVDFDGITPVAGQVYELTGISGCWEVVQTSESVPTATVATGPYDTCEACNPPVYTNYWEVRNCETFQTLSVDFELVTPIPGEVYELTGISGCWQVLQLFDATPITTVSAGPYTHCDECLAPVGTCEEWDISNYSLVEPLYIQYKDCNDNAAEFTLLADSDYVICSIGAPTRTGGSNSYVINPTGTPC